MATTPLPAGAGASPTVAKQLPQTFDEFDAEMKALETRGVPKQDRNRFAEVWKFKMQQQGKDPAKMYSDFLAKKAQPMGPIMPDIKDTPMGPFAAPKEAALRGLPEGAVDPTMKSEFETERNRIENPKGILERARAGAIKGLQAAEETGESARRAFERGDIIEGGAKTIAAIPQAAGLPLGRAVGEVISPVFESVKPVFDFLLKDYKKNAQRIGLAPTDEAEQELRQKFEPTTQAMEGVLNKVSPEDRAIIGRTLEGLLELTGFGIAKKPIQEGAEVGARSLLNIAKQEVAPRAQEFISQARQKAGSLFKAERPTTTIDDVISQVDEAIAAQDEAAKAIKVGTEKVDGTAQGIRKTAEAEAPKLSIGEKWAGVSPDLKKRIQGKPEEMKEYFDITHARNSSDEVPSPLEYAVERGAVPARDKLETILNDTGSEIGKFRESTKTTILPPDKFQKIETEFGNQLAKFNLELGVNQEGKQIVKRVAGKVKSKIDDSEIGSLQRLLDDLVTTKQNPTMENVIDLRDGFGNLANYAKSSREASSNIDPLVKKMRSTIRGVNLEVIPKEQAKLLEDYSDLLEVFGEMDKAINSKSGAEFLLKRVLSERGRAPRELFDKVKEYTGIDLMDHATMAMIAREIVGNPRTKGLFQQEITNAGINVFEAATGSPSGIIGVATNLMKKIPDKLADAEKMFMKAANDLQKTPKPPPKSSFNPAGPAVSATPTEEVFAKRIIAGGGTTSKVVDSSKIKSGIAYSPVKNTERVFDIKNMSTEEIAPIIKKYKTDNAALLEKEGNVFGAWMNKGKLYLDISNVSTDLTKALDQAREAKQIAVYDLLSGKTFNLSDFTDDQIIRQIRSEKGFGLPGNTGKYNDELGNLNKIDVKMTGTNRFIDSQKAILNSLTLEQKDRFLRFKRKTAEVYEKFKDGVLAIAEKHNVEPEGVDFMRKSDGRSIFKMFDNSDLGNIVWDMNRGGFRVSDPSKITPILADLKKDFEFVRVKNRIESPTTDGYRDILVNVRNANGTIAEIQVIPENMAKAKDKMHLLYEEARDFLTTDARKEQLMSIMKKNYAEAWEKDKKAFSKYLKQINEAALVD